jgi:hypothetical protein
MSDIQFFIGLPIGLGLGFLGIKYIYFPYQEMKFARELYGEDHLCNKKLHKQNGIGDDRCMKNQDVNHCHECEKYFCMYEFARSRGLFWWYKGQKKSLLSYIKRNKLTPYPDKQELNKLEKQARQRDRDSELEMRSKIEDMKNRSVILEQKFKEILSR